MNLRTNSLVPCALSSWALLLGSALLLHCQAAPENTSAGGNLGAAPAGNGGTTAMAGAPGTPEAGGVSNGGSASTLPPSSAAAGMTAIDADSGAEGPVDAGPGFVPPERPNIVVILTDDQGWNGTSVQMMAERADTRSDYYEMPNLERLANQGMTLSNGYASHPNCSPTRLSLLTGKNTARLKMTDIINRTSGIHYDGLPLLPPGHVNNPTARIHAISAAETTLPELIKAQDLGYRTAHFGKWHIAGGGPGQHGFDEHDGGNSNGAGDVGGDDPKQVFSLAQKGRDFIAAQAATETPFYLQLSHYATHLGYFALESTLAKYEAKTPGSVHNHALFAAMTEDLDTSIGQVLDALEDPNQDGDAADSLLPNTYIVLLADNGAHDGFSDNYPLNHGKASAWEGGVRVPFFVAGPGIEPGSRSDTPVVAFDILPTVAEWLGTSTGALGLTSDGASFAQLVRAESSEVSRDEQAIVFHWPHYQVEKGSVPMSTIRVGNEKLVHFYETGESLLFDLEFDLEEQQDLRGSRPERVAALLLQLRDYLAEVEAPMPLLNPNSGPGTLPDVDNDGLDDAWEFRQLLTTSYSGTDDPDGDGQNNAAEFLAGSDPLR